MYPAGEFVTRLLTPFGGTGGAGAGEALDMPVTMESDDDAGDPPPELPPSPPPSPTTQTTELSRSSSSLTLSAREHSLLSSITRSKLERAAAGRMAGGRGAPSLRQLVLWTNTLVSPAAISAEEDDEEELRRKAEQEWFENLMEEMVDLDDDDDEDDEPDEVGATRRVSSYTAAPLVPALSATNEDERYVNIRFRHRGRSADSGFLEGPTASSHDTSDEDDAEPAEEPLVFPPRTGASPPPTLQATVSALTAQLRRPEDVPLPASPSPSPSPEGRVIVRSLEPEGTQESWSGLLECEEVSLAPASASLTAPVTTEEDQPMVAGPSSSWGSEPPALTPDSSPPTNADFDGRGDDDEVPEDGPAWHHRLLRLRNGKEVVHRERSRLSLTDDPFADESSTKTGDDEAFGSWLLGDAPFATQDDLALPQPPGLDALELAMSPAVTLSIPPPPPLPPVPPRRIVDPVQQRSLACAIEAAFSSKLARTPATSEPTADGAGRKRPTRRWSGIVRTWYDCVDLGLCTSTDLAPFGDVQASSSSGPSQLSPPSSPKSRPFNNDGRVADDEIEGPAAVTGEERGKNCRAEEALAMVLRSSSRIRTPSPSSSGSGWLGDETKPSRLRSVQAIFRPPSPI